MAHCQRHVIPCCPRYPQHEQAAEATDREREAVGQPGTRPGEGVSAAVAPLVADASASATLDVEALARALRDLLAAADKHAKFGNYPGVEEWDDAYDKAVLALASIEQAAEAAGREAAGVVGGMESPDRRELPSAAVAPLDGETLYRCYWQAAFGL